MMSQPMNNTQKSSRSQNMNDLQANLVELYERKLEEMEQSMVQLEEARREAALREQMLLKYMKVNFKEEILKAMESSYERFIDGERARMNNALKMKEYELEAHYAEKVKENEKQLQVKMEEAIKQQSLGLLNEVDRVKSAIMGLQSSIAAPESLDEKEKESKAAADTESEKQYKENLSTIDEYQELINLQEKRAGRRSEEFDAMVLS